MRPSVMEPHESQLTGASWRTYKAPRSRKLSTPLPRQAAVLFQTASLFVVHQEVCLCMFHAPHACGDVATSLTTLLAAVGS